MQNELKGLYANLDKTILIFIMYTIIILIIGIAIGTAI
jgi:hypothetical protein